MRRKEIDWIRNIAVLMLFLYHTAIVFDSIGDSFIKTIDNSIICSMFIIITFSWYMPLLFLLAGASTKFSLDKRSSKKYLRERVKRILIPLIFGIIVLVPAQGYFARLWRGEEVSFVGQYKYFATNITNFQGYDGAFTPAHLWFLLFLFIISLVGVYVIKMLKTEKGEVFLSKIKTKLLSKYIIFWASAVLLLAEIIPRIGGKSLSVNLMLFLIGYVIYSDEDYLSAIDKNKHKFLIGAIAVAPLAIILYYISSGMESGLISIVVQLIIGNLIMITAIVAIIGYGRKYLNRGGKTLNYLNKACLPIYIMHQTILIGVAYFIAALDIRVYLRFGIIAILTAIFTFSTYEILRRTGWFNRVLGMR